MSLSAMARTSRSLLLIFMAVALIGTAGAQAELEHTAQSAAANLQAAAAEKGNNALNDVENWLNEAKVKMAGVFDKAGAEIKQIADTTGQFVQAKAGELGQQLDNMVRQNNQTAPSARSEQDMPPPKFQQ